MVEIPKDLPSHQGEMNSVILWNHFSVWQTYRRTLLEFVQTRANTEN